MVPHEVVPLTQGPRVRTCYQTSCGNLQDAHLAENQHIWVCPLTRGRPVAKSTVNYLSLERLLFSPHGWLAVCAGLCLPFPSAPHCCISRVPQTPARVHPHCDTLVAPQTHSVRLDHVYPRLQLWEEETRGSHSRADPKGHHTCFWPLAQLSSVTTWLQATLQTRWAWAASFSRATTGAVSAAA